MARIHRSAFHGGGKATILWVCGSRPEAIKRWLGLGEPDSVQMANPGQAMAGLGFDEIIIEGELASTSPLMQTTIDAWLRNLRCRLNLNGKWRVLSEG